MTAATKAENQQGVRIEVHKAVERLTVVEASLSQGLMEIEIGCQGHDPWFTTGVAKRTILDRRRYEA